MKTNYQSTQSIEGGVKIQAPKVAILMCTYQAENYLIEQIDSIVAQSHTHWQLFVSDDGSKDKTSTILKSYLETLGQIRLSIFRGPAKGFVGNFLSLTCKASIEADVYAYSDQDDIWDKDKLECAIQGSIHRE